MSLLLVFLLKAVASPIPEPGETTWVQGDVVNLRPRPQLTGEPVARLRIGTELQVLEQDRRALRVRVTDRPDSAPVEGWVSLDLVGPEVPTVDRLDAALAASPTAEQERALATRRAALAGDPDAELWIGLCRDERTDLVAHLDGDALVFPVGRSWSAEPDPELMRIGRGLSAAGWFSGPQTVPGTPFATPFTRSNWNDGGSTAWAAADCGEICGDQVLVLGPCVGPVVATRPVIPTDPLEVPVRETRTAVAVSSPYDDGVSEIRSKVTLTRPDGTVVFETGADGGGLTAVGETSWYAIPMDGGTGWLAHLPTSWSLNTRAATLVLLRPDGRVVVMNADLDGSGC